MAYVCEYPFTGPYLQGFDLPGWTEKYRSGDIPADVTDIFHDGKRPFEPGEAPEKVLFTKKAEKLPDIFSARNGVRIITDRVRRILEEFDPGVHQILPIEAVYRDGSQPETPYFIMNVTKYLDAVNDELSSVKMEVQIGGPGSRDQMVLDPPTSHSLILNRSVTEGHHFWREKRYYQLPLLMSDEMHAEFKAQKIKGYKFWHAKEQ
ncbi:MAG: DUF1629 domain-containing protein [Ruegeria sp.]